MTSDVSPAWWVRMVAADALEDHREAIESARRLVAIEGFGQEWLSLAILLERDGDAAGAGDALRNATLHAPVDPVVELNAAVLYQAIGDTNSADEAVLRLLAAQPDIEPILKDGPPSLATAAANLRARAASDLVAREDLQSAFLVALSGEDHDLAVQLLATLAPQSPSAQQWSTVVDAWFGDPAARAMLDERSMATHDASSLEWSWRVAGHACDAAAAEKWQQASEIGAGRRFSTPSKIGRAPDFQVNLLPRLYPGSVWKMSLPTRPYVSGIWSWTDDRSGCTAVSGP